MFRKNCINIQRKSLDEIINMEIAFYNFLKYITVAKFGIFVCYSIFLYDRTHYYETFSIISICKLNQQRTLVQTTQFIKKKPEISKDLV